MDATESQEHLAPVLLAEQRRASRKRRERERATVDEAYGDWLEMTFRERDRDDSHK